MFNSAQKKFGHIRATLNLAQPRTLQEASCLDYRLRRWRCNTPGFRQLLALVLVLMSACAQMPASQSSARPAQREINMREQFEKAERFFEKKDYEHALNIYEDYLYMFPNGGLADKALMRIGEIHKAAKHEAKAEEAFRGLIAKYPQSPLVPAAQINLGEPQGGQARSLGSSPSQQKVLLQAMTPNDRFKLLTAIATTQIAEGKFSEAIKSLFEAYGATSSDSSRSQAAAKIKELSIKLNEQELSILINAYSKDAPAGYLLLQLARLYLSKGLTQPAKDALNSFVTLFPGHEERGAAVALLKDADSMAFATDRNIIGCILPLSGKYASIGAEAQTGIELALSQMNQAGQQNSQHPKGAGLQLVVHDSRSEPAEAIKAVETLVKSEKAIGIIGPMVEADAVLDKVEELKVPIIALTQRAGITEKGEYTFRNFLTPAQQARALVKYAAQDLGLRKFAILYPQEKYGISFMHLFWDEVVAHGGQVVGVEAYGPQETDFGDVIKKLIGLYYPKMGDDPRGKPGPGAVPYGSTGPAGTAPAGTSQTAGGTGSGAAGKDSVADFDAIFIPDGYNKAGLIAPQLLYHDISRVLILGTNLWHSDKLISIAQSYVQGAVLPEGFFLSSQSPKVREFVASYQEVFGKQPSYIAAQAYDAARMMLVSVSRPDVQTRYALKTALAGMKDYPGVTGLTSFDATGDALKDLCLLKIEGRNFVQIKP